MISDKIAKQLHDKSTRGKVLTPEESKLLKNWYTKQDNEESKLLLNHDYELATENILNDQIGPILTRIGTAAEQIHKITDENKVLRQNIAKLQRQLEEKSTALSA